MDELWFKYQASLFLITQPLSPKLSLAIISAHNPMGEVLSPCQNRLRDRLLLSRIQAFNRPYRSLIGASNDLSYMEKSWAVFFIDQEDALALGREFNQLAIYYVDEGHLSLLSCFEEPARVSELGPLYKRLKLVNELPDLNI